MDSVMYLLLLMAAGVAFGQDLPLDFAGLLGALEFQQGVWLKSLAAAHNRKVYSSLVSTTAEQSAPTSYEKRHVFVGLSACHYSWSGRNYSCCSARRSVSATRRAALAATRLRSSDLPSVLACGPRPASSAAAPAPCHPPLAEQPLLQAFQTRLQLSMYALRSTVLHFGVSAAGALSSAAAQMAPPAWRRLLQRQREPLLALAPTGPAPTEAPGMPHLQPHAVNDGIRTDVEASLEADVARPREAGAHNAGAKGDLVRDSLLGVGLAADPWEPNGVTWQHEAAQEPVGAPPSGAVPDGVPTGADASMAVAQAAEAAAPAEFVASADLHQPASTEPIDRACEAGEGPSTEGGVTGGAAHSDGTQRPTPLDFGELTRGADDGAAAPDDDSTPLAAVADVLTDSAAASLDLASPGACTAVWGQLTPGGVSAAAVGLRGEGDVRLPAAAGAGAAAVGAQGRLGGEDPRTGAPQTWTEVATEAAKAPAETPAAVGGPEEAREATGGWPAERELSGTSHVGGESTTLEGAGLPGDGRLGAPPERCSQQRPAQAQALLGFGGAVAESSSVPVPDGTCSASQGRVDQNKSTAQQPEMAAVAAEPNPSPTRVAPSLPEPAAEPAVAELGGWRAVSAAAEDSGALRTRTDARSAAAEAVRDAALAAAGPAVEASAVTASLAADSAVAAPQSRSAEPGGRGVGVAAHPALPPAQGWTATAVVTGGESRRAEAEGEAARPAPSANSCPAEQVLRGDMPALVLVLALVAGALVIAAVQLLAARAANRRALAIRAAMEAAQQEHARAQGQLRSNHEMQVSELLGVNDILRNQVTKERDYAERQRAGRHSALRTAAIALRARTMTAVQLAQQVSELQRSQAELAGMLAAAVRGWRERGEVLAAALGRCRRGTERLLRGVAVERAAAAERFRREAKERDCEAAAAAERHRREVEEMRTRLWEELAAEQRRHAATAAAARAQRSSSDVWVRELRRRQCRQLRSWLAMRSWLGLQVEVLADRAAKLAAEHSSVVSEARSRVEQHRLRVATAQQQLAEQVAVAVETRRTNEELIQLLDDKNTAVLELEGELAAASAAVESQRQQRSDLQRTLTATEEALGASQREVGELEARLREAQTALQASEVRASRLVAANELLEQQVAQFVKTVNMLAEVEEAHLGPARAHAAALEQQMLAEREAAAAAVAQRDTQLADAASELAAARRETEAALRSRGEVTKRLEEVERELRAAQAELLRREEEGLEGGAGAFASKQSPLRDPHPHRDHRDPRDQEAVLQQLLGPLAAMSLPLPADAKTLLTAMSPASATAAATAAGGGALTPSGDRGAGGGSGARGGALSLGSAGGLRK